jgi:hypothetical protein
MESPNGAASVYFRNDIVVVAGWSYLGDGDGDGGSVLNGWVASATNAIANAELGKLVRSALATSTNNVPMPDFSQPQPNLLKLFATLGVKTEAQFGKGNLLVSISQNDGRIGLLPTRNLGRRGGFDHLPDLRTQVPDTIDDAALGEDIRRALNSCS